MKDIVLSYSKINFCWLFYSCSKPKRLSSSSRRPDSTHSLDTHSLSLCLSIHPICYCSSQFLKMAPSVRTELMNVSFCSQHLCVQLQESIGKRRPWVRSYFSSSAEHVTLVSLMEFMWLVVSGQTAAVFIECSFWDLFKIARNIIV